MITPLRSVVLAAAALIAGTVVAINLNSSEAPAERTYVGQQTCMTSGCHEGPSGDGSIYAGAEKFKETFHQKIHLRPSPETVRIERYFENDSVLVAPVNLSNVQDTLFIHFSKSADKKDYLVSMRMATGDTTPTMKIAYTYGGNGWIQRYLVEINGSFYPLPFQYLLGGYKDFTDTSNVFYFIDFTKWAQGDPNSNPPKINFFKQNSNQMRKQSWDKNCAPCHVNGFNLEVVANGTDTSWNAHWVGKGVDSASQDINISIGCESCHGPGSEHVASPTTTNIISPRTFGNTRQGTDLKLDLCNQCHNRMQSTGNNYPFAYDEANNKPYIPGIPIKDYVYKGNQQIGARIWPDSSEYAHHQHGQDYMRSYGYAKHIYKNGCWSCHTVHNNKKGADGKDLPFQLNQDWYSLKDGEGCLTCHGSLGASLDPPLEDLTKTTTWKGKTVNAHTMHAPEIGQCVNCHFSKTASISFIGWEKKPLFDFTSHHFFVIRPNMTRKFKDAGAFIGQINTCSESCHRNGRGSRNYQDGTPAAPAFGTNDKNWGQWNEKSDLDLADSLWFHYQEMYSAIMSADREAGPVTGATAITSILPNPVTESTTIRFSLAKGGNISLEIYNVDGEIVRQLASSRHEAGNYVQEWDGTDDMRRLVPAGTYLVRLKTSHEVLSKNVVVVR
jgi:hypothetical protein